MKSLYALLLGLTAMTAQAQIARFGCLGQETRATFLVYNPCTVFAYHPADWYNNHKPQYAVGERGTVTFKGTGGTVGAIDSVRLYPSVTNFAVVTVTGRVGGGWPLHSQFTVTDVNGCPRISILGPTLDRIHTGEGLQAFTWVIRVNDEVIAQGANELYDLPARYSGRIDIEVRANPNVATGLITVMCGWDKDVSIGSQAALTCTP